MRNLALTSVGLLVFGAVGLAQVEEIRRLEQQYTDNRRSGASLTPLLSLEYFDVIPPGTTRTAKELAALQPAPKSGNNPELQVRRFGDVGLVTGLLDGPQGNGRDRFLRVWVKEGGQWKTVAFHGTWMGEERTKTAQPLLPEPNGARYGYKPTNATEQAIWAQHEAVEAAGANADQNAYRTLTTADFVRVTSDGVAHTREDWVKQQKGSRAPARQTNVRLRVYGDVGLLTYLNVAQGPENNPLGRVHWMTRIFTKQTDGTWKLLMTQSTPARQPTS